MSPPAPPSRVPRPAVARPPSVAGALLLGGLLAALAGCRRPDSPTPPPSSGTSSAAQPATAPWFREIAAEAGLHFQHRSGHRGRFLMPEINTGGVGLLDFDRDGLLDVFCVNGGFLGPAEPGDPPATHRLFRNLGGRRFEDVTERAGVGRNDGYGMGVACGDYDGDGWTDLLVLNLGPDRLYRNLGNGTFADVTARAGVAGAEWSSSAAFLDYDADGHLDLAVVNYLHWTPASEVDCFSRGGVPDYCSPLAYRAPAPDRLYRNRGDGTFEDVSVSAGFHRAFGNGLGIATGDFDHDGRVDLFVANDAGPNQLWLNRGNGRFEDDALLRGCALSAAGVPRAGMGVVAVDLLQRGWLDLFVTHLAGEGNGWFQNTGGTFQDVVTLDGPMLGSRVHTGFGVGFQDFDHDGEVDLYVANGRVRLGATDPDPRDPYAEPDTLLRGIAPGRFAEVEPAGGTWPVRLGAGRGAAFADLDNDGAVDVLVLNRDGPLHFLHNQVGGRGAWVGVEAVDARGHLARQAIVRLEGPGRTQWRQVQPNEGYASSHDPRLVFGLGQSTGPARVTIRWSSGQAETFANLPSGNYHRLVQGHGTPAPPGSFAW